MAETPIVAYFSMEMALDPSMPTYSGGLGVLAGDTVRAAADLGLPMVAVTLLHRKGYLRQHLDSQGNQSESPASWSPEIFLQPVPPRVELTIEGQHVLVRAWRYVVRGISGHEVPVYLLDTALRDNSSWVQTWTDSLYGKDQRYRLCQEAVLGLGGVAVLRALGYTRIDTFHMNEGHSALLGLALLEEQTWGRPLPTVTEADMESVRRRCVFTTHSPTPAAHDQFPMELVTWVLGKDRASALLATGCCSQDTMNMTYVALSFCRYVNGVGLRHKETSMALYPDFPVNAITNGVHAGRWTSKPFQLLYDQHIPEWRRDNLYLRYAVGIPLDQIWQAHLKAKHDLLVEVERRTGVRLEPTTLTLGFARRATSYKRLDLLFYDLPRLQGIARRVGHLQILCGGKAHPQDEPGKAMIRRIFEASAVLRESARVVFLEDYEMALASYLCAGVDVWLNTPQKPQEASGTSGMKAALNGVPSLSVRDGWWVEGCVEGVTGWAIGDDLRTSSPALEARSLYDKLEYLILPTFYSRPQAFAEVMRSAIALNGAFFNAQRMVRQYMEHAYTHAHSLLPYPGHEPGPAEEWIEQP